MRVSHHNDIYALSGSIVLSDLITLKLPIGVTVDLVDVKDIEPAGIIFLRNSKWKIVPPKIKVWEEINALLDQQRFPYKYDHIPIKRWQFFSFCKSLIKAIHINTKFANEVMWNQMQYIGWQMFPSMLILALCCGVFMTAQVLRKLGAFGLDSIVPTTVTMVMTSQIGPLIGGQLLASQCASAISADMAEARLNQEWDALIANNHNPYHCYCLPRIYACAVMYVILIFALTLVGLITAAIFMSFRLLNASVLEIIGTMIATLRDDWSFLLVVVRAFIYGIVTAIVSLYIGCTSDIEEGVGKCVNSAVFYATFLITLIHIMLGDLIIG